MSECICAPGRCDKCGRFISLADFQNRTVRQELVSGRYDPPAYKTHCASCVLTETKQQAQEFAADCEKVGL